jgi:hypothetical protein
MANIPEVNRLWANRAVPEASEASWSSLCSCSSLAICLCGSEEGSEAAEDAGAGTERHDGGVFMSLPYVYVELGGGEDG